MSKTPERAPQVLFEDADWLVLDKPAHWVSIPGRGDAPSLLEWAQASREEKVWVVHRLDRETSGVILFAKQAAAHRQACVWFEGREVKKRYEFLAEGQAELPSFKVDEPIEGAAASTRFERVAQWAAAWQGRAFPRTGRRHQIRIHLAHRGSPVVGDPEYGAKLQAPRVMLHAAELELPNGARWSSPLPEDFAACARELGGRA